MHESVGNRSINLGILLNFINDTKINSVLRLSFDVAKFAIRWLPFSISIGITSATVSDIVDMNNFCFALENISRELHHKFYFTIYPQPRHKILNNTDGQC